MTSDREINKSTNALASHARHALSQSASHVLARQVPASQVSHLRRVLALDPLQVEMAYASFFETHLKEIPERLRDILGAYFPEGKGSPLATSVLLYLALILALDRDQRGFLERVLDVDEGGQPSVALGFGNDT